ncbi:velvet factor-domain-containing protein [Phascolomyces articulosus]|uniref:Velvet factor-domain-containing protein n=1 Tax=Phascolomyces articulosus TaxID=60185 RepID=A0AAD5KMD1_9FUNG|nr:velvet factor-domain-containing protein [Phascolomyces articulosus]
MNVSVPPPLGLGRPSRQSIQYRLVVVQHPTRARCCGFGEKDKRPINPPPILQLYITHPDGSLTPVSETDNVSHLIVQCDLFSGDRKENRNIVYNPASINPAYPNSNAAVMSFQDPKPIRNFLGTLVSNAHQLMDLHDRMGIFFIFHDVSVRTEGNFCLRFRFIDLSAGEPLTMSTRVLHEVYSNPFSVYSAKNFPGMTGTTPLSLCFSKQGIKISVRKGPGTKRTSDTIYGESSSSSSPIPTTVNTMTNNTISTHTIASSSSSATTLFAIGSKASSSSSSSTSLQHHDQVYHHSSSSQSLQLQQEQHSSSMDKYHQRSVNALTTFVYSGTQRTSGKERGTGDNPIIHHYSNNKDDDNPKNRMEEIKETTMTIESRSQEAIQPTVSSLSFMIDDVSSSSTNHSVPPRVETSLSSSSFPVPPHSHSSFHTTTTTTPTTSTATPIQYTKIHISSVLASDNDDDDDDENNTRSGRSRHYPW